MDETTSQEVRDSNGSGVGTEAPVAQPTVTRKEPEAIIQKVARGLKVSNFIYIAGVLEMAAGIVLGVLMFFVNMAGFRGYGSNFYYNMPRLGSLVSSLASGLFVLFGFMLAGLVTIGFGKIVQAAEIYIQRRSAKK